MLEKFMFEEDEVWSNDNCRTCEAMNNSGSPPHTCGLLIRETYVSKSPSTNLYKSVA